MSIPNFHRPSYHVGITAAFAEIVAMGVKRLALSSPYDADEFAAMLEPTRHIAAEYHLPIYVERELLITRLFPADIAAGKIVILIAQNQTVLDEYLALKQLRADAEAAHRLAAVEDELAWRFGRLLSYSDEAIRKQLSVQR